MIRKVVLIVAFLLMAVGLTATIAHVRYFLGDVEVTRALQAAAPADLRWAEWLSAGGRWPWLIGPAALAVLLSFYLCGLRAAAGAVASVAAVWFLDKVLRHLVFQPRPAADLVHVVAPQPHGSAFPSLVALIYGGTFGYVATVAIFRAGGTSRWLVALGCIAVLVLAGAARIVLGAHWPSDILVSFLYAFVIAAVLILVVPRARR